MEVVKELFGTEDLYAVLGTTKEKADDEKSLRMSYLKAALKFHPDKAAAKDRDECTKKFQMLQKIYELFQDKDSKKSYDETGLWPEDDKFEVDLATFGRLDENAILEFKKLYQGSEEEKGDIKKYYIEGKGDICHICDNVFFLNILDDEERVTSIIEDLISKGEVERLSLGKKGEKAVERKKKRAQKEAEEAEQIMKERNMGGGLGDLEKALARNMKARSSFLDGLEAKYGGGAAAVKKGKRNGKNKVEASEESEEDEEAPQPKKSKAAKPTKSGTRSSTRTKK